MPDDANVQVEQPYRSYLQLSRDLKDLAEYVSLMSSDYSMPRQITPIGNNSFRIQGRRTLRLPTYDEVVAAIELLRSR